ncbi:dUTP diphosphatase [Litchfieldia alkalitelluris]|uniref:dUTP diphosphatase n=1 Tax=Litchfieldia alkalitelluris TaxID=304268 RepID=UPI00099767B4|nr:dUTP diphosphatase [Litchfieldia alkalitelluris]
MNLHTLYKMQSVLDQHIVEQHQLQKESLFDRKVLALLVELGELANETRSFKYWSLKPPASETIILEEFVDGVHFILSLGIELGYTKEEIHINSNQSSTAVDQFLLIFQRVTKLQETRSKEDFVKLVQDYFSLAYHLGFTQEQIIDAYVAKNEVNFKRQEQGY